MYYSCGKQKKVCITRRRVECVKKLESQTRQSFAKPKKKAAVSNLVGSCPPSQIIFFLDGITYILNSRHCKSLFPICLIYIQSSHACAASDLKCTTLEIRAIGMSSIENMRDSIKSNLCPPAQILFPSGQSERTYHVCNALWYFKINRMSRNVWEKASTQFPFVLKVRQF